MIVPKISARSVWRPISVALPVRAILPALFLGALALALTWPTVSVLTTRIVSQGADARHNLWVMWHLQNVLAGVEPLFYTSLLYFPVGISMLVHGIGPVPSILSLPFTPFGMEATYNGAVLLGFFLTGYCTYLLARTVGLALPVALFAGTVVLASELHLAGLLGHIDKIFLAMIPLALLAWHKALDKHHPWWWSIVTAFVLLLVLLTSGWQFVVTCLAIALYGVLAVLVVPGIERPALLKRIGVFGGASAVLVLPLLVAINIDSRNPALYIDYSAKAADYAADLVEFFVPSRFSLFWGDFARGFLRAHQITWNAESAVAMSYTALLLCLFAVASRARRALPWLVILGVCFLCALGPELNIVGWNPIAEYNLPITLPYTWVSSLPGLSFMRTPSRFMYVGVIALGMSGAFGLAWLVMRAPKWGTVLPMLAILFVLVEAWPTPWSVEQFRPVPEFYQEIAHDPESYGVFDLPIEASPSRGYVDHSSFYQMYQMTHHKGIASGYLSRTFLVHPVFPCLIPIREPVQPDILVNNTAVDCFANASLEMAHAGYRYVVFHKPVFQKPSEKKAQKQANDTLAYAHAHTLIARMFEGQAPIVDDELSQVYALPPVPEPSALPTAIFPGASWYWFEGNLRWTRSPATLTISWPREQSVVLEIVPAQIFDPAARDGLGDHGALVVQTNEGQPVRYGIQTDIALAIPLELMPGFNTVSLALEQGNFYPGRYGSTDPRALSFSIRSIHLKTQD